MIGASILGGNELYAKLKKFKSNLCTDSMTGTLWVLLSIKVKIRADDRT
jgi:hypothetical protein